MRGYYVHRFLTRNLELYCTVRFCVAYFTKLSVSRLFKMSQEERPGFWEVTVSVILSKKVYMYMCPNTNGFGDRVISLYSSKIVDKKEILRTVSNIYRYLLFKLQSWHSLCNTF
jgi:hypothetical protein